MTYLSSIAFVAAAAVSSIVLVAINMLTIYSTCPLSPSAASA